MAISERIRYIRNLRGMSQKMLGIRAGFNEKNADVRIAQYESGIRKPKKRLINTLAEALDVSPSALQVPDIDSFTGVMQTLFALEDLYGLKPNRIDGTLCLALGKSACVTHTPLFEMFDAWWEEVKKLQTGEITKEEYDAWRYTYPSI